jgi:ABC-type transport system involved in multi-copper enzyme maturation permease subunit
MFAAPALTMRLFSEEKRTGTLGMLLTAPITETSVVVSKFLAAWLFYLVVWLPWGLFLVALRMEAGQPFDYRPLLSFFIALLASGAAFLSMGLFVSSLTRNQIIAFILGCMAMMVPMFFYFVTMALPPSSTWHAVFSYLSFVNFWGEALEGTLRFRDLLLQVSVAVFWLFLTVRVLEARKWS